MKRISLLLLLLLPLLLASQNYPGNESIPGDPESEQEPGNADNPTMSMEGQMGAVTIDNTTYTQLRLLPQFKLGKFGFGLDVDLLVDKDGNIRNEDWNEWQDYLNKIYYVSYGSKLDKLYCKLGSIPDYTLGHGLIFDNYSNMLLYPGVKNVGGYLGVNTGFLGLGFEGFTHNIHENKILALRAFAQPFSLINTPLLKNVKLGVNVGMDRDQYDKYPDKDKDEIPDVYDKFPDDRLYALDTDDDGIADELDFDLNGNGILDHPDYNSYVQENFSYIVEQYPEYVFDEDVIPDTVMAYPDQEAISVYSFDYELPLIASDKLALSNYGEIATIDGFGHGLIFPGFAAKFLIFDTKLEMRTFSDEFLPAYFDQIYDNQRSSVLYRESAVSDKRLWSLSTKEETLSQVGSSLGWFGFMRAQIFESVYLKVAYQDNYGDEKSCGKSLWSSLTVNPTLTKKIREATLCYSQTNNRYINFIEPRNSNAHLSAKIVYAMSDNVNLIGRYSEVYNDLNGDGKIRGIEEVIEFFNFGIELIF